MTDIQPFTLSVPESQLDKLKQRLANATFPDELDEAGWDLGSPLADVRRLTAYWKDTFDWRKAETKINRLPQFTTSIQAEGFDPLKIHFVHQKSEIKGAIPLLFCHGWPGSFIEVDKLLRLLAAGDGKKTPAFHVVAPSLPNFGFSEGSKKRGFGLSQYAETCHKLMQKLGYTDYVTQGGDWGAMITRIMGILYPDNCKASHINYVRADAPTLVKHPLLYLQHLLTPHSTSEKSGFARSQWFLNESRGYHEEQSTKPQTIGYALADSPMALLAWIYEKLHDWTDGYSWTNDEILTWISIYWFSTAGPAANLRIYYEATHTKGLDRTAAWQYVPKVKLGVALFPRDVFLPRPMWAGTLGNVVLQSIHAHGGHFAATEHPEIIAEDLMNMFGRGGGAFGVVKGRDGYAEK